MIDYLYFLLEAGNSFRFLSEGLGISFGKSGNASASRPAAIAPEETRMTSQPDARISAIWRTRLPSLLSDICVVPEVRVEVPSLTTKRR